MQAMLASCLEPEDDADFTRPAVALVEAELTARLVQPERMEAQLTSLGLAVAAAQAIHQELEVSAAQAERPAAAVLAAVVARPLEAPVEQAVAVAAS